MDIGGLAGALDLLTLNGSLASLKLGPVPYAKLPKYGGIEVENLATLQVLDLAGSGTLLNVSAGGAGAKKAGSTSVSVVEKLTLLGLIKADLIGATCSSSSNYSTASSSADSTLVGLTIGGKAISVSTAPNTRVDLIGKTLLGLPITIGSVVINEQIRAGDGVKTSSITNNALHVYFNDPTSHTLLLGKVVRGDIVVSSARCEVNVTGPNPNDPPVEVATSFVTGGGRIDSSTGFATFGFNARSGRGQLEYIDHGTKMNLHSESVSSYTVLNTNCVRFAGTATLNNVSGHSYSADVCDFGEPGRGVDTFSITIDNGTYSNARTLSGGNIQLHN